MSVGCEQKCNSFGSVIDEVSTTEGTGRNSEPATIYFTSSIKHCWSRADTCLACWSLLSPLPCSGLQCVCVRVRVCMEVCVCVQSKYSPGIRVWAWKNKTLALKQRFADVVWPRVQPLQSVITTCVCVYVGKHLLRQVGPSELGRGGMIGHGTREGPVCILDI